MADETIRQFVVLKADEQLHKDYARGSFKDIEDLLRRRLAQLDYKATGKDFEVVALPSREWVFETFSETGEPVREDTQPVDTLDVGLVFFTKEAVDAARKAIEKDGELILGIGADIPFHSTDCWCPGEAADPVFGSRKDANELIYAGVLNDNGLNGRNVNVVIIDRGLDPHRITLAGRWRFGPATPIPVPSPSNHAMMVARHIQKTAPRALIYDCALLPEHISNIGQFITVARSAYARMVTDILFWKLMHKRSNEWVFVNAWAIYDRRSEYPPGDYTNNPANLFNLMVEFAAVMQHIDIVFAAGNCGLFCPNMNCGRNDRGPDRSIFGANCHRRVLTTGAVRTDGMWLGYSSQGEGQSNMATQKPDLCVPSQFCEVEDAHLINTGTSASCALAAGVIAALRSGPRWGSTRIPPETLRDYLITTARKTHYPQWSRKLGHGILDVRAAFNKLVRDFGPPAAEA